MFPITPSPTSHNDTIRKCKQNLSNRLYSAAALPLTFYRLLLLTLVVQYTLNVLDNDRILFPCADAFTITSTTQRIKIASSIVYNERFGFGSKVESAHQRGRRHDIISSRSQTDDTTEDGSTYYSPNNIKTQPRTIDAEDSTIHNDNSNNAPLSPESTTSINEYSFFDEAVIYVRAGSGGQGSSTYKKSGPSNQNGIPDGGNGGNGGNVYLVVDTSLNTLTGLNPGFRPNSFGGSGAAVSAVTSGKGGGGGGGSGMSYHSYRPLSFRAENGFDGERQFKNGRYGKDVFIRVPPGTVVQEEYDVIEEVAVDSDTIDDDDDNNTTTDNLNHKVERKVVETKLIDLGSVGELEPNDDDAYDENGLPSNVNKLLVAKGGDGGEGSGMQGYRKGRGVKRTRSPPVGGERRRIKLTLKIVADVALVGVPNAGKSTFLAAVTRAKPKIANYPFTTVIPNLGVWIPPKEYNAAGQDGKSKTSGAGSEGLALCDVPGLIAGAADGIGLGHAFLRHVERCHVILHLVDATSSDPIADFHMVNDEILRYGNGNLAKMPQIVVVNKIDAWEEGSGEDWEKGLKTRLNKDTLEENLKEAMTHSRLMWMSAKEKDGVDDLMGRMASFVKKVKAASMS